MVILRCLWSLQNLFNELSDRWLQDTDPKLQPPPSPSPPMPTQRHADINEQIPMQRPPIDKAKYSDWVERLNEWKRELLVWQTKWPHWVSAVTGH